MGSRGQAGNGPANDYETRLTMAERMACANTQVFVTVMLETGAAFDHLDAIAAMPGIDALTLGPTDLAQDLGVYGSPDENRVLDEHRRRIIDAANRHGKTAAMLVSSAAQARQWKEAGVLLLGYSSEVGVLQDGYRRALAEIKA
jgi:2-dehydro-3-deoxyglucarate aldolase/4-hydroxy-2-oxoheptanedioate aldolase